MRVVRGAMNIDKHPQHFWLNFTTFRRFSPFHLFHCSSTINRAAGRRGYGHVSAPKGQATSFYRQHFSKSNDQTQMIPNLIVEIVEQKMLVIKNCIDLDGLHSIHLHLSHLSPLSWWSRKECKELRRSLPSIAVKPPPPPAIAQRTTPWSFLSQDSAADAALLGSFEGNDTKSQLHFGVRITKTYIHNIYIIYTQCFMFRNGFVILGKYYFERMIIWRFWVFLDVLFLNTQNIWVGHAQKERT